MYSLAIREKGNSGLWPLRYEVYVGIGLDPDEHATDLDVAIGVFRIPDRE